MWHKKVKLEPKFITCSKCGHAGGTLQKNGLGGYCHQKCPPRKQVK